MPRRVIPFTPNQYYHFYNRGNNRQAVFFARENYLYFLQGVRKYLCEQVNVLAYCLMPTHYHILGMVKQKTSEFSENSEVSAMVSKAMMRLGVSYTKAINKRFARVGALFQGQFQGKPIITYSYLLNLCIYIHANPVKDGLVALPEDWEFSNYLEWMGMRNGKLVNREFISENFGAPEEYRELVMEHVRTRYMLDDFWDYLKGMDD